MAKKTWVTKWMKGSLNSFWSGTLPELAAVWFAVCLAFCISMPCVFSLFRSWKFVELRENEKKKARVKQIKVQWWHKRRFYKERHELKPGELVIWWSLFHNCTSSSDLLNLARSLSQVATFWDFISKHLWAGLPCPHLWAKTIKSWLTFGKFS